MAKWLAITCIRWWPQKVRDHDDNIIMSIEGLSIALCSPPLCANTQVLLCCCDHRRSYLIAEHFSKQAPPRSPPPLSNQKQWVFIFWTIRTIDRSINDDESEWKNGIRNLLWSLRSLSLCVLESFNEDLLAAQKHHRQSFATEQSIECSSGSPSYNKLLYSIRRVQGRSRCLYRRVACGSAKWFFLTFHYAPELGNYYAALEMEA